MGTLVQILARVEANLFSDYHPVDTTWDNFVFIFG